MLRAFFAVILSLIFLNSSCLAATTTGRSITVFAEPNLAIALTKIARIYAQKTHTVVSVNFNSAYELVNSIDSGEPADVFISAHPQSIESLRQKGLVDVYNIGFIARDKLILAALKSNTLASSNFPFEGALRFLDQSKSDLIIDNEGSSSGFFAKSLLNKLSLQNIRLYPKIIEDKTTIISSLKSSDNGYSLLLSSQYDEDNDLQILAEEKTGNIFYQALVIAGDNMDIAREFLKFLKKDEAKKILRENRFLVD